MVRLALLAVLGALVACKPKEVELRAIDAGRSRDAAIDARPIDAAVAKPAARPVVLAAGADATCAVLDDLSVRCWGANDHGQLGNGSRAASATPVAPELHAVKDVQLAGATACALLDDGSVTCWGRIAWHGKAEDTLRPTGVLGVTGVTQLFVLPGRSCGRVARGSLVCWGDVDPAGHVGTGSANRQPTPAVGMMHVVALTEAAALEEDGTLVTWGAKPVTLAGVAEVGVRDGAVCGRMSDGSVQCPVPHCAMVAAPPEPKPTPKPKPKPKQKSKPTPKSTPLAIDTLKFPPAKQLAFELGWCVVTTAGKLVCGDPCDKTEVRGAAQRVSGHCVIGKTDVRCDGKPIAIPPASPIAGHCAIVEGGVVCWGADGALAPVAL